MFVSALACAEVCARVMETDPASPVTLGHWKQYYLRIAYDTDRPVRVRADAYSGSNRFPLGLIFTILPALIYLTVLFVLHRFRR